ncbi:MAG: YkgJ family cysteine cluster protein [Methanomassiliicoccales archaeon]|jgi:Fe-S-cluster containining protein
MRADPVGGKVKCARCGWCCLDTQMELGEEDVEHIERLGFSREAFSVVGADSIRRLRNVGGRCFFLVKAEVRCRIYQHRPKGCAIYPVNITEDGEIVLDGGCKAARTVTKAEMDRKGAELKTLIAKIDSETISRKANPGR